MANRVKEVSAFNGTSWGAAVPLGVNDANIDITSSTSQPDGSAVSGVTGDSATALDTAAVAVASGDTGASAWTKFNRFRKRVASNFANYIQGSIATSYNATGSDSAVYSTNVLNNYMANVIGYSGTTAPEAGSVADQLSSLNDNIVSKPPLNQRKILLLGDSYNYGNGGIDGHGWGYYFNQFNGTNGTVVHQNTGGFAAVAESANASYNNCTYAQVIDQLSASENYDLIIAQAGWNDASTGRNPGGASALVTGVNSFVSKCKAKWPSCEIIVIATNNRTVCDEAKINCLNAIVDTAVANNLKATRSSYLWMQSGNYNASDNIHLSDAGYQKLAQYITNYINGWDGDANISYTTNGSNIMYFPQGLKIVSGQISTGSDGKASLTYPVKFTNTPNIVCMISGVSQASVFDARAGDLTTTGCNFAATRCNNGGTVQAFANASIRYFIIGI